MIVHASARLARETRHHRALDNGFSFHRSEWMQSGRDPVLSPTVFLVEQPPGSALPAHFHMQNQFQVVKEGRGTLGPHAIGPGSVHYAGAFTGYGPLVAGPEGLSYFTIRAVFESGANFIAEGGRRNMRPGPKRHAQGPVHEPLAARQLMDLGAPARVQLIEAGDDELEAFAWQLPPSAPLPIATPRGSGQFQLVLSGELHAGGCVLDAWESRFLSVDERDVAGCRAGPHGLHLLVLQMPAKARAYTVPPV
jgi:hypothetical protein